MDAADLAELNARQLSRSRFPPWLPCLVSFAGIAICTCISFRLGQNPASVGFIYLIFVVLAAVYGGFWQATLISLVSVACLDYFFNPPIFSFTVDKPADWVELGAFEFTSVVITQLSNRAQLRAREAEAEKRTTARLFHTARRILLLDCSTNQGDHVTALICETFGLRSVVLFDGPSDSLFASGERAPEIEGRAREAYGLDSDAYDSAENTRVCILRLGPQSVGALALRGAEVTHLTAIALASLCAIALERARALERQSHAEAVRQAEQLRTAVLDALAHKFKTPLTIIRTASSGVPAAGHLSELQTELISLIDQEAAKLNDLASRLLSAPNLDDAEFALEPEPVLLSRLVRAAIQELEPVERDRFEVTVPPQEPPVFADKELILTALAQLVDNALKYSFPATPIEASVSIQKAAVLVAIRSRGLTVAPGDSERIFERFYRTPGAKHCAIGTGLGLSIVKTIAKDHQGKAWVEGEPDYGTKFSLSLPISGGPR